MYTETHISEFVAGGGQVERRARRPAGPTHVDWRPGPVSPAAWAAALRGCAQVPQGAAPPRLSPLVLEGLPAPSLDPEELDPATLEAIAGAARADAELLAARPSGAAGRSPEWDGRGVWAGGVELADLEGAHGLCGRAASGREAAEVLWPISFLDLPVEARLRCLRSQRAMRRAQVAYIDALRAAGGMGGGAARPGVQVSVQVGAL